MSSNEGNERQIIFASGRKIPLTHHELHEIIRSRGMYGAAIISCVVWVWVALLLDIGWVSLIREDLGAIFLASLGTLAVTVAVYFGGLTLLLAALPSKTTIFEPALSAITIGLSLVFGYGIATVLSETDEVLRQLSNNFLVELVVFFLAMQIVVLSYPHYFRAKLVTTPASNTQPPPPHDQPLLPEQRINLGYMEAPAEELVCLSAKGHYVQIVTTSTTLEVRATMTSILPLLPDKLGKLVHRSHWVCKFAVQSAETKDGRLWLTLTNGDVVSAARSRKPEITIWLGDLGIDVK